MPRMPFIILTIIMILFMTSPIQISAPEAVPAGMDAMAVLADIVEDFEILASVWRHGGSHGDNLPRGRFSDLDSATVHLGAAFEPELAHLLATFLLTQAPDADRMTVVSAEFIPMIGPADLPRLRLTHPTSDTVVIQCCYDDCYQPGDRYRYTITARNREGHWKISGLTLEPVGK